MRKKFVYFILLLCLVPAIVMAGSKGRIKGKITDLQTGEPLVGANVVVEGTSAGATSDINGVFTIQNVDPGTYRLRSSFIGYQSVTVEGVRVSADLTVDQNFQLPAEGITVSTVTIIAEKPLVNKDNTNAVRVTTSDDIKALPIRGVAGVISLTAGVVAQNGNVHVRGGRGDEIGYYLDGVSVTDHVGGGNGVTVSQDAVEEIQVQAGGYTAEFGGANSGIIRQQLKSGTSQYKASVEVITDNIGFKSKDNVFDGKKTLGAYTYGYDEISAVLSGPVYDQRIKFFGNVDYVFRRDQTPQPFPGINIGKLAADNGIDTIDLVYPAGPVKGNSRRDITFTSTVNFDFNPYMIRLSGTYTDTKADLINAPDFTTPVLNILNSRLGVDARANGTFNAKFTHVLSPELYYEVAGGYNFQKRDVYDPRLKDQIWLYGDSAATAQAGYNTSRWTGPYATPENTSLYGFAFTTDGSPAVNYSKYKRESLTANAAVSWLASKTHSLKFGGEFQYGIYRTYGAFRTSSAPGSYAAKLVAWKESHLGAPVTDEVTSMLRTQAINDLGASYFGYDVFGNETNGTGADKFDAPHKPVFFSGYVQDKIEYQDLVINAGLRFDYIDVDNLMLKDAAYPDAAVTKQGDLIASGFTKTPINKYISPRLGFSFPVTERTMFHAQYGKFIQQTKLNDIYQGYNRIAYMLRYGYFFVNPSGSFVNPTKTTQYELGFTQQLTDNISVDVTGYYKDIKDQIVFVEQLVDKSVGHESKFNSYYTLANGDFATTKGVEINFTMRRTERLAINGSLSLQDAQGTGSFPNSNRGIVGAPIEGLQFTPKYVSPLEFNNAVKANMNFDYRFGENDGPSFLHQFGVSLLMSYASGHPFTRGISGAASLEDDARNRQPVEPLNASVTPSTFRVDLRVDKSFDLFSSVKANIYVQVINLFDKKNVENVFLRTGAADDDGYLSNPELGGKLVANNPNYAAVYKAINLDYAETFNNVGGLQFLPYMYGAPRQIRLGIRLEY